MHFCHAACDRGMGCKSTARDGRTTYFTLSADETLRTDACNLDVFVFLPCHYSQAREHNVEDAIFSELSVFRCLETRSRLRSNLTTKVGLVLILSKLHRVS